jgi:hypothetical protein
VWAAGAEAGEPLLDRRYFDRNAGAKAGCLVFEIPAGSCRKLEDCNRLRIALLCNGVFRAEKKRVSGDRPIAKLLGRRRQANLGSHPRLACPPGYHLKERYLFR